MKPSERPLNLRLAECCNTCSDWKQERLSVMTGVCDSVQVKGLTVTLRHEICDYYNPQPHQKDGTDVQ